MPTPFQFLESISSKEDYQEDLSGYVPWVINKGLSAYVDTLLYANEMNLRPDIDPRWQYDYLYHSIRAKKRAPAWIKDVIDEEAEDLEAVKLYFGMSTMKAREALSILTREQLERIRGSEGGRC